MLKVKRNVVSKRTIVVSAAVVLLVLLFAYARAGGGLLKVLGLRQGGSGALDPAAEASTVVQRNIPYGEEGKQVLDLCRPKNLAGKAPGVALFHGGGGDKADFLPICKQLAASGYVAAAINFREEPAPAYPLLMADAKLALAWLRERPDVDGRRMAAWGGSLGGYLSSHLGTREDTERVQCVVNNYGPTDLFDPSLEENTWLMEQAVGKFFNGVTKEEDPDLYRDASPITHVSAEDAEFVFTRSVNDRLVPKSQAERMIAALRAEGKDVPALFEFQGTGNAHALKMGRTEMQRVWEFQKGFLDRCLA